MTVTITLQSHTNDNVKVSRLSRAHGVHGEDAALHVSLEETFHRLPLEPAGAQDWTSSGSAQVFIFSRENNDQIEVWKKIIGTLT